VARKDKAVRSIRLPRLSDAVRLMLLAINVGIVAGLGAIAFQWASQTVSHYALGMIAGYQATEPAGELILYPPATAKFSPWLLLAVITVGGLISGVIVFTFAPEAEGHGTDAVIKSFHREGGKMRARIPLVKLIASAITIGTGGSAGREGPIAQIGAGFGSLLATLLRLSTRDRRILLAAGMGAGIGSIFRATLAGAIFAAEILYSDAELESDVIVPATIASLVAFCVHSFALPYDQRYLPLFGDNLNIYTFSPSELVPLALLAGILALVGGFYIRFFYGTRDMLKRIPVPAQLRPAIGAALAGIVALGLFYAAKQNPQSLAVLSNGYGALQVALADPQKLGAGLLIAIAFGKILTTSLTIGSGGSGGVFGPSIVIGGCLSAALGSYGHQFLPGLVRHPEIYGLVGMAGFFAGCAHAPISTIIMVSEITGDYRLLVPTMWVSTLCFLMGYRWKLYTEQVPTRRDSPAHQGERGGG
jgi:CIC family chloride channel protein